MSLKGAGLVLICMLALAAGMAWAAEFPNPMEWFGVGKARPTPSAQVVQGFTVHAGAPESFAPIARATKPAVVNISTTETVRTRDLIGPGGGPFGEQDPLSGAFQDFLSQMPRRFTRRNLGSGVIIDAGGDIVTNAHVVMNADKVLVKLEDKREFDAKIVGIDRKTDVALLKIESPGDLKVASLGSSEALEVGDWVVAIGIPFGLAETVTAGIVSAKGRVIGEGPYDDFIQTDASINPGNSGGPLLDLRGQVVGINAATLSQSGGSVGIGFAVPIDLVKSVVEQLKAHGKVIRGWFGAAVQDITPALARSFGLEKPEGALVGDVIEDSPAAHGGLERGDIITDYGGTRITEARQLPMLVGGTEIGKTVMLTVLRKGETHSLQITVAEMPAGDGAGAIRRTAADWGMTTANISPGLARRFNVDQGKGVVITAVSAASPAEDAGLQPGDVIVQVDREPVGNLAEYRKVLAATNDAQQLLLLVERQGQGVFVVLSR